MNSMITIKAVNQICLMKYSNAMNPQISEYELKITKLTNN